MALPPKILKCAKLIVVLPGGPVIPLVPVPPDIAWSPSGAGSAKTFTDVEAIVETSLTPNTVYLTDSNTTYLFGTVDMKGGNFSASAGNADSRILSIPDGAIVRNLGAQIFGVGAFNGAMKVQFNSTGVDAPLQFDTAGPPQNFAPFEFGGGTLMENLGTRAVIDIPPAAPDSLLVFIVQNNAAIGPGAGLAPIVSMGAGSNCIIAMNNNINATLDPGWIVGDATNFVAFLTDGGFDFSLVASWVGIAACAKANQPTGLDGGSGPTAFRPMGLFGPLASGVRYFDTDLVPPRPIYWDGVAMQWNDALGAGPV